MALTILQLIKYLPMTSCRDCGYATCMAFASHVIKKKEALELCPHLSPEIFSDLNREIKAQQVKNLNVAPDRFKTAREFVMGKIQDYDFAELAPRLGGEYVKRDGKEAMLLSYLGQTYEVSKEEARALEGSGEQDVWDVILLFNYIASNCRKPPAGKWIDIDALPGSIPKKPELKETCEKKIAQAFRGDNEGLRAAIEILGGTPAEMETSADVRGVIHPLPRTPFLLLFWDEDPEEGFEPRAKVLFDESILCFLDIESMVFLAEKLASRLINIKNSKLKTGSYPSS